MDAGREYERNVYGERPPGARLRTVHLDQCKLNRTHILGID
jgi:hypothetical protein